MIPGFVFLLGGLATIYFSNGPIVAAVGIALMAVGLGVFFLSDKVII